MRRSNCSSPNDPGNDHAGKDDRGFDFLGSEFPCRLWSDAVFVDGLGLCLVDPPPGGVTHESIGFVLEQVPCCSAVHVVRRPKVLPVRDNGLVWHKTTILTLGDTGSSASVAIYRRPMDLSPIAAHVIAPTFLTPIADIRSAPREKGIYAWWFEPDALKVPSAGYFEAAGKQLLYVGIAPRKPSAVGKESASRLRNRLIAHATKDASRSTLRLSLGALLSDELSWDCCRSR